MVSQETNSSPRISFSADLDEKNDIPPTPNPNPEKQHARREEFEFLSTKNSFTEEMLSADELIFEGKLLPFFQINQCEKVNKVNEISTYKDESNSYGNGSRSGSRSGSGNGWFIDEDPSPRSPSCTVLWKELLKLKKQNSSSSSSSSSSQLSSPSLMADIDDAKKEKSSLKRVYKKTTSIRIRPVVNVPICSHAKNNAMPHLFSFKKGKLET